VLQLNGSAVPAGSPEVPAALLNVQIKVDTEWFKAHVPENRMIKLPKLLIARVKGTSLLQSFFVTVCITNGTGE